MTTTTYYNLNIVEGTDIVNPLIVDNPNYEKIDETMHNNAVAGVTLATEITNATVHAITRENSDCAVIRFIATSQWKAGDTATVDGVPVTALLPSGETLPDGAYVINANVLCILTGTNLTIYTERKKTENANEIAFNDTTVGAELVRLNEEDVRLDNKINTVNSNFSPKIATVYLSGYTVPLNLMRSGNIVVATASGNFSSLASKTSVKIGDIPTGYIPYTTVQTSTSPQNLANILITIGENGYIEAYNYNSEITTATAAKIMMVWGTKNAMPE